MVEMANIKPKKAKRSLQMTTTRPKVAKNEAQDGQDEGQDGQKEAGES